MRFFESPNSEISCKTSRNDNVEHKHHEVSVKIYKQIFYIEKFVYPIDSTARG